MKTTKLLGLLLVLFLSTNIANAQKVQVSGTVKGKTDTTPELLNGVNVYLKDKSAVTTTNRRGEFTFPKTLNVGDVLVFSYLGYLKKQVTVRANSTNISVLLDEDDNEMLGAVATNKRFTSKRRPKN